MARACSSHQGRNGVAGPCERDQAATRFADNAAPRAHRQAARRRWSGEVCACAARRGAGVRPSRVQPSRRQHGSREPNALAYSAGSSGGQLAAGSGQAGRQTGECCCRRDGRLTLTCCCCQNARETRAATTARLCKSFQDLGVGGMREEGGWEGGTFGCCAAGCRSALALSPPTSLFARLPRRHRV